MAEETLYRAIVELDVKDNDTEGKVRSLVERVAQTMQSLGQIPVASLGEINTAPLTELMALMQEFRQQALHAQPIMGGDQAQYAESLKNLDALILKTRALNELRAGNPVAMLQAELQSALAAQRRLEAEKEIHQLKARDAAAARPDVEAGMERLRMAQIQASLRASIAGESAGGGGDGPKMVSPISEEAARAEMKTVGYGFAEELTRLKGAVAKAREQLESMPLRKVPDTPLGEAQGRIAMFGAIQGYEGAQRRLNEALTRHADEENAAATQAEEARRAQADPRLSYLTGTTEEYAAGRGLDSSGSLRMQALAIEQDQLHLKEQALRDEAEAIRAGKSDAATLKRIDAIDKEREGLTQQIRNNEAAQRQQGFKDGGRGGFFGGLLGTYNSGGEPPKMADMTYQAGQATKYFVLYSALSMVQRAMTDGLRTTAEYSRAVADLGVALGTAGDQAHTYAAQYAAIGSSYGTDIITSTQAATKFARTFRNEDGSANPQAGMIGAQFGGYMGLFTQDRSGNVDPSVVEKAQQDTIAILRAYKQGVEGVNPLLDKSLVVANQFGYTNPGEILSGTAALADIGKESGFSQSQLLATIASGMQYTGTSSDMVAGDLKRFLGTQTAPATVSLMERYGVNQDQSFFKQLEQLSRAMEGMTQEEKSKAIAGVGDARTGAIVVATINGMDASRKAAAKADSPESVNEAQRQADERMASFGETMRRLGVESTQAVVALMNLGLTDLLTSLAHAGEGVLAIFSPLIEGMGQLPGPVKEVIAALVLMRVAAIAFAGAQAAFAGSALFAGAASGAASAAGGMAALTGGLSAMSAGLAGVVGGTTSATAGISAVGLAAKGAVAPLLAAAPAIIGVTAAIAALLFAADAASRYKKDVDGLTTYRQGVDAQGKAQPSDLAAQKAALDSMQRGLDSYSEGGQGSGGVIDWLAKAFANGGGSDGAVPFVDPSTLVDPRTDHGKTEDDARANVAKQQALVDALVAKEKALTEANAKTDNLFGKDFNNVPHGIELLKSQGFGADSVIKQYGLAAKGASLDQLFPAAGSGLKTLSDVNDLVGKQISRMIDPLQQLSAQKSWVGILTDLRARAVAAGRNDDAESTSVLLEQANKAYVAALVTDTQQRIESIKSLQGNTAGARGQIRALITTALNEAGKAGDVSAMATLLGGVDRAFFNAYRAGLIAQQKALRGLYASLKAAADMAAMQERVGLMYGVSSPNDAPNAKKTGDAASEAQKKLDAIDKIIAALAAAKPTTNFTNSSFTWPKDKAASGPTAKDIELARIEAQAIPGDSYSEATVALKAAKYQLATAKDKQAYWQALKAVHQAQYDLAKLTLEEAKNANLLRIDITDPVAKAKAEVLAAQAQLRFDQKRGATKPTLIADQVAVRQTTSDAQSAAWNQQFSDAQTNYELQRTSLSAYLNYLNAQKTYLSAVKHRTRQQVDELNQVERALKGLADGLQGQWNLGDIKIPTPYEMRRQLAGGGMGAASAVTNVTITISGSDLPAVRGILSDYLGQGVIQASVGAPARV